MTVSNRVGMGRDVAALLVPAPAEDLLFFRGKLLRQELEKARLILRFYQTYGFPVQSTGGDISSRQIFLTASS